MKNIVSECSFMVCRYYSPNAADIECPVTEAKPNLSLEQVARKCQLYAILAHSNIFNGCIINPVGSVQFMGLWYILEYQYPKEMGLADLSCLSFRFSQEATGIKGNFSFRFPPRFVRT